jgi:hypothetical protein
MPTSPPRRRTLRAVADRPTTLPPPPPDEALAALVPRDVELATGVGVRHEAAVPVWYGVVWGRLGRGDLAAAHLDRVHLPELQPWIAAERGRLRRELGFHAEAEAIEWPALLAAQDAGDPTDAAMLRISLTADAVGAADADRARRRLEAARDAVAELPDGPRAARQRIRLCWVAIEVAALTGERPDAHGLPTWRDGDAGPSFDADHEWGTRFHRAKSLLFAGVLRGDPLVLDAAAAMAPPGLLWAIHLARLDLGLPDAETAARRAWSELVPPPELAALVEPPARLRAATA